MNCPGCGWPHEPGRLDDALQRAANPSTIATWPDHVVIALNTWARERPWTLQTEAARRTVTRELANRYTARYTDTEPDC